MNRDNITLLAREADIDWHKHWNDDESNRLEVFANRIEKEIKREASFDRSELWLKRVNKAVEEEREACKRLVWTTQEPDDEYVPLRKAIADAISARGKE
jgi:hypothetical protein